MKTLNKLILAVLLTSSVSAEASSVTSPPKMTRVETYSECIRFVEGVTLLSTKIQYLDKDSKSYSDDINKAIITVSDKYHIDQSPLFESVVGMTMYPSVSSDQLKSFMNEKCVAGISDGTLIDDRSDKPID